ncbi:MAG: hypothetical protein JWN86_4076 [Planctomycetota bacterium]|nr:hypothetical protein [Planctomycetota bacterium]
MNVDLIIPLAGIALPAVLVPTILSFRYYGKQREFEHLERMKALETGQPVPGDAWPGAFVCAAVGAGVPVGSFLFTFLTSVNTRSVPGEIWLAPAGVSVIALWTCFRLASTVFRPSVPAPTSHLNGKPAFDPVAYDMAGHQG